MIRRAWRVLADPPASDGAALLRFTIPIWAVGATLGLLLDAPRALFPRPVEVVWLYVVLWAIRQRDEARTRLRQIRDAARAALNDLPGVQATGHQDSAVQPSTTATAPPARHPAPDPRRRNEDI